MYFEYKDCYLFYYIGIICMVKGILVEIVSFMFFNLLLYFNLFLEMKVYVLDMNEVI